MTNRVAISSVAIHIEEYWEKVKLRPYILTWKKPGISHNKSSDWYISKQTLHESIISQSLFHH